MARMIKAAFSKYPMLSNALFYGTLTTSAEFTQQVMTRKILAKEKPQPLDTGSLKRYAIMGTCIYPNILFLWYKWLDGKYVGTARNIIVKKVILDQFVLTAPLLCVFFVVMSALERKSDVFEECRQKFVPTFMKSCVFWMPAQTINFLLIPNEARIVYIATCAFAWINILVWVKRQEYAA